ncbi:B3 domain-containing protein REM1 [Euphorbia peplus]|nr:B3 domain-containing protein REM1 [Euphorbia peplus]
MSVTLDTEPHFFKPLLPDFQNESEYSSFVAVEEENLEIQQQNLPEDSSNGKNLEENKEMKSSSGATDRENPCSIIQLTLNSIKKSRLHIPHKFAREHGLDDRCCSMILKDEEGNCWPALLYKSSNGKTYIAGGWTNFCVAHKLKAGGSLLVELTENGLIPVLKMIRLQEVKPEIMDQNNAEDDSSVPGHLHASTEASNLEKSHSHVPEGGSETSGLRKEMEKKKVETRCEVKASPSFLEYPSFVITLEGGVIESDRVYIPHKFVREHGLYSQCSLVYLKNEQGHCWPAKLVHSRLRSGTTCVADGWTSFRIAHHLKSGDSVIFELIKFGMVPILKIRRLQKIREVKEEVMDQNIAEADSPSPGLLHATTKASNLEKSHPQILDRGAEKSGCLKKLENQKIVKTRLEPIGSSDLEHPNCVIKLTLDSILRSKLYIPGKFARICGLNSTSRSLVLTDEEEKCWPAKLNYTNRKFLVRDGWGAFHRMHKLKAGDSLIVEVVKTGKTPVIKIRRESRKDKQLNTASEQRFFVVNISDCWSGLYIPVKLANLYLENNRYSKVMMIDREGRSWPANVDDKTYIVHGWHEFRVANNLKPGDSFVFEFIENKEMPILKLCEFKPNQKAEKNEETASSSFEKPCFYVTVKSSDVRDGQIKIPTDFAWSNGLVTSECSEMSIKNEMGNSWAVKTKMDTNGEVFIRYGWSNFAEENGIKEGDVFMLELIKEEGKTPLMNYYAAK